MSPRALEVRRLRQAEWSDATGLMARAFVDEPFIIGLYGHDRLERFGSCLVRYRSQPWPDDDIVIGALVDDVVVGVVVVAPPHRCHGCDVGERPDDPVELLDWGFYSNCRAAHLREGDHAWLGRLAAEPALRGCGIGSALLQAGAAASESLSPTLLLECEGHRQALYERAGFRAVSEIPDELGPPALLMRRDRGATGRGAARSPA